MKRIFDIFFATLALCLTGPVIILVAIVVRVSIGSPIFFIQQRPGMFGVPFQMVKFRTMRDSFDVNDNPLPDHQRVTAIGRFLRSSSLDELPELWNVLRGEMSLVGPRPLLMEYLPLYSIEQARRHNVRPGITGWAQINGRNALTWEDRFRLDAWYVDNQSFLLDLRILAMTVVKVLAREGISAPGEVTMSKFTGRTKKLSE